MDRPTRTFSGAPGIIDVAARAGVSPATVSRCFNSPDMVKPGTKSKIQAAANELGYVRDRMAAAMHNRFSGTIGMVVPTINNAIFSELIESFSSQLQLHDRTMLVASHNYDLELEASIIRSLLERRIDGIALVGQQHLDSALQMLKVREVPTIALWGYQPHAILPFVGADNLQAAYKITNHLIELGHKDIAFIFPDTNNNDRALDRKNGALKAMHEANLPVPSSRMHTCPYDIAESKRTALSILKQKRPSAIVCGNDVIAHGAIYAAHESAIALPAELSIVGIGDFAASADIVPSLTTVRIPAKRIGQIAAQALVNLNEQGATENQIKSQLIDTQLIVRDSSCAAP